MELSCTKNQNINFIIRNKPKKLEFVPIINTPQPSRNRWVVHIPTELGVESYWCTFARPQIRRNAQNLWDFLHSKWDDLYVEIESHSLFFPNINGNERNYAHNIIMEWFRLHSESVTGRQGYTAGYKKTIKFEMIDPTGVVVEKWVLHGVIPREVSNFTFPHNLGITFSMDNAMLIL